MIEELIKQDQDLLRTKINAETAKMAWLELQRCFAAGKVMWVDSKLDLVDVALAMHQDDIDQVKNWSESQQLSVVSDDQAKDWVAAESSRWTVVVKPWVLVQEKNA